MLCKFKIYILDYLLLVRFSDKSVNWNARN